MSKASVGDGIAGSNANWTFGQGTAARFDEHVSKSVPLYSMGHDLIVSLSDFFINSGSVGYEIGCSTGTLTLKLAAHNAAKSGARFVGVDIEPEMVEEANRKKAGTRATNLQFVVDDSLAIEFEPADMIVAYYVVQFVRPSLRQRLIDRLYQALNWGGALILFEKVRGPDARFQDISTALYQDFKLAQGYTPDEIVAKSRSLKGVLEPFSTQGNIDMMRRAGFSDIMTIMKYTCFEGFLAIK
jgi:tRNA (cmo5U34)-methyltransferase